MSITDIFAPSLSAQQFVEVVTPKFDSDSSASEWLPYRFLPTPENFSNNAELRHLILLVSRISW